MGIGKPGSLGLTQQIRVEGGQILPPQQFLLPGNCSHFGQEPGIQAGFLSQGLDGKAGAQGPVDAKDPGGTG